MTKTSLGGCAVRAGGGDHAFADAEFHFPRGEVGDADDESADEIFGLVGFFDAGEDVFRRVAAEAERELEQLLGVGDVFGGDDAGDAEVDLGEVVDRALGGERLGGEGVAGVVPLSVAPAEPRPLKRPRRRRGLLSSIMACTSFSSTRWSMCVNLSTGVPTSGVCDWSQCLIGSFSSSPVCWASRGKIGRQVDDDLAEQVERDRADVLQARRRGAGPCAAPTACRSSTYGFARSARPMISRMALL